MLNKLFAPRKKGIDFNPAVFVWFVVALAGLAFGVYGFFFLLSTDITAKDTPNVKQVVSISTLTPLVTPEFILEEPTLTPTSQPSPTPSARFVSDCDVLALPQQGAAVVGVFLNGTNVTPVGLWFDWVKLESGWVRGSCFQSLPLIGEVSPPMIAPTASPSPELSPTVMAQVFDYREKKIPSLPTVAPSPTPQFSIVSLPDGFMPGWCVKVVSVAAVWLPDGNRLTPTNGGVHLSQDALNLNLVYERNGYYYNVTFPQCGIYQAN